MDDDVRSVTPEMLSLKDNIRNIDPASDIACSSGRPEISDFNPYRVDSILYSEDLEVLILKYQIPSEYKLEVAASGERIALPCPSQIGLYEEALKIRV